MAAAREQEAHDAVVVGARFETPIVVQHGRHDSGRAVGRCRDHLSARRVFLVDRQRERVHPIEGMHRTQSVRAHQLPVQLGGAPPHAEHAGQQPLCLEAAPHAVLHHLPYAHEPCAYFGLVVPRALASQHQLVDFHSLLASELRADASPESNS